MKQFKMSNRPCLFIAIPVKNEEEVLGSAIKAALSNSFPSTQVHIFDDFSTDGSYKLALEYSKNHSNCFVHKNTLNLGVHGNFNKALISLSTMGSVDDYIALLGANDLPQQNYYSECINYLLHHPECQLCFSQDTEVHFPFTYNQENVYERLAAYLANPGSGAPNYGVLRTTLIDKLLPFQYLQGADHVWQFNILMHGIIHILPGAFFTRGSNNDRTEEQYKLLCTNGYNTDANFSSGCKQFDLFYNFIFCALYSGSHNLDREKILKEIVDIYYNKNKIAIDETRDNLVAPIPGSPLMNAKRSMMVGLVNDTLQSFYKQENKKELSWSKIKKNIMRISSLIYGK